MVQCLSFRCFAIMCLTVFIRLSSMNYYTSISSILIGIYVEFTPIHESMCLNKQKVLLFIGFSIPFQPKNLELRGAQRHTFLLRHKRSELTDDACGSMSALSVHLSGGLSTTHYTVPRLSHSVLICQWHPHIVHTDPTSISQPLSHISVL